jgi:hypothetical protein
MIDRRERDETLDAYTSLFETLTSSPLEQIDVIILSEEAAEDLLSVGDAPVTIEDIESEHGSYVGTYMGKTVWIDDRFDHVTFLSGLDG